MTFQRSWPFSRGLLMVHYDNLTCSLPADISKVVNCFKKAKTSIWKYSYMFMGLLCIFIEMDFSFLQNHVWFLHLSKKMRSQLFYLILTQRDVNVFFSIYASVDGHFQKRFTIHFFKVSKPSDHFYSSAVFKTKSATD